MKNKLLLLITLLITIFIFNDYVYAESIFMQTYANGANGKCSKIAGIGKNTCFKITNKVCSGSYWMNYDSKKNLYATCHDGTETKKNKILYCTEYYKNWGTGYGMSCTKQKNSSLTRNLSYVFEKGFSEYSNSKEVNNISIDKKSTVTDSMKKSYDNTQVAIWYAINSSNIDTTKISESSSELIKGALSAENQEINKILTLKQEKPTTKTGIYSTKFKISVERRFLINNKLEITLTNVNNNLQKSGIFISEKQEIKNNSTKFNCQNGTCKIEITIDMDELDTYEKDYYILANADENKHEFNITMSVKTYLQPNNSTNQPISYCNDANGNVQKVVKYDRKEYTVSKTSTISWKQACDKNCPCGKETNEYEIACCPPITKCPDYKCKLDDPGEQTSECNNGVSMKSTCEELSIEKDTENNIISLTEEGTLSNTLSTNEIFAGGVIKFNLIYYNKLSWNCVEKSKECDDSKIITAINDRIKTVAEIESSIDIAIDNSFNGNEIKCQRINNDSEHNRETICTIKYTKNTSVKTSGIIPISVTAKGLDILKNTEDDSENDSSPWTGKWKVSIKNLNPTANSCNVTIKEGKYNKFRYRPIDLDKPFPSGKIPVNWFNWYNSETNPNHKFENTFEKKDYELEITPETDKKIEKYYKENSIGSFNNLKEIEGDSK